MTAALPRRASMVVVALVVAGAALFVSALAIAGQPASRDGRSGIDQSQAIELASTHVGGSDARYQSMTSGLFRAVSPDSGDTAVALDRMVWAVSFTSNAAVCPPPKGPNSRPTCTRPLPTTTVVYLDYRTGEFLESAARS